MKPTEIQIGDLLTFEECLNDEAYPVIKVTGILQDSFFARIDDAKADDELDYEGVVGIPLTAEILEKNGFVYNDLPFVQSWEQFGLSLYSGGNGYRIVCGNNIALIIDSVHELQHCLKLCGIEKEIVV